MGERATVLDDAQPAAGYCHTLWNIHSVAPGIYIYRLVSETEEGKKVGGWNKLVVVK
jgi:hypothetical protein